MNVASDAFVLPRRAAPTPRYGTLAMGDLRLARVFWDTGYSVVARPYPSSCREVVDRALRRFERLWSRSCWAAMGYWQRVECPAGINLIPAS